jgi:hypothetical protein
MQLQTLIKWYWYLKRVKLLALGICLFASTVFGQTNLNPEAQVSLLTCGSGNDLYSIFGHTAIRVKDTAQDLDIVFNYGTFEFTDDFYIKFTRGKLNYKLSIEPFENFEWGYRYENRWVKEQVLNLSPHQEQAVFDYLRNNYKPENRKYLYDFFYDNCSTRPRDVFENVLGDRLIYNTIIPSEDSTFKDMLDVYLPNMPWSDAGMDLGLGAPADKVVNEHEKMFLPDYLFRAFATAEIQLENGDRIPLVKKTKTVVPPSPQEVSYNYSHPFIIFWLVLGLYGLVIYLFRTSFIIRTLDCILYNVVGLFGWVIVFLWFFTDHTTTQNNLDLLWTLPVYFPLGVMVLWDNTPRWMRRLFFVAAVFNVLLLGFWPLLPQDLNEVYIPIIILLLWRNLKYSRVISYLRGRFGFS